MTFYYLVPQWFFGFDIITEMIFALITFLVAFFAYRIYTLSGHRGTRFFAFSFLLISFSYVVWAAFNLFIISQFPEGVNNLVIEQMTFLGMFGIYAHLLLFTSGLVMLAYTTCKITSGKAYYLMLGLSLLTLAASTNKLITFRILSIFLFAFIIYNYLEEYAKHGNKKTLLVMFAFVLLLASNISFILSLAYYQAYITSHLIELAAYSLILTSLVLTHKQ